MRISEKTIENVFNSMDIYDTVSEFVTLQKKGTNYTGCCPFHDEKTPSFSVSPAKQIFKCFGCGKGGNAIHFLMEKNMTYPEAIIHLANKLNITIVYDDAGKDKENEYETIAQIERVLAAAERQFIKRILTAKNEIDAGTDQDKEAIEAYQYITKRGYSFTTINEWRIGYAAIGNILRKAANDSGTIQACIDAGILSVKDGNTYDVMQGRIVFPIHNHFGKLVGFGGRIVSAESKFPKYMNTKETKLYNKSNVLFGLHLAQKKIKELGYAILVEGYTDVISFHTAGAQNTVATCGTALTDQHCKLLKRYTDHIILARDGDKAGTNAINKDTHLLLAHSFKVEVFPIVEGKDPDQVAKDFFIQEDEEVL